MTTQTPEELKRHPLYIEADGGIGRWDAEVYLSYSPRRSSDDSLLCLLKGARMDYRFGQHDPWDSWRIDFATEATDFEHDRCHFVDIWLVAPKILYWSDSYISLAGFGTDIRLPTQEWLEEQLASTDMCSYCTGGDEGGPHAIAEYIAPERREVNALGRHVLMNIELKRKKEKIVGRE